MEDLKDFKVPDGYRLIKLESLLVPKGKPIPKTMDGMYYLFDLYDRGMQEDRKEMGKMRAEISELKQKLESCRNKLSKAEERIKDLEMPRRNWMDL